MIERSAAALHDDAIRRIVAHAHVRGLPWGQAVPGQATTPLGVATDEPETFVPQLLAGFARVGEARSIAMVGSVLIAPWASDRPERWALFIEHFNDLAHLAGQVLVLQLQEPPTPALLALMTGWDLAQLPACLFVVGPMAIWTAPLLTLFPDRVTLVRPGPSSLQEISS